MFPQIILYIAVTLTWSILSCTKSAPSLEKQESNQQSRDQGTQPKEDSFEPAEITKEENGVTSSVEGPLDEPFPQNGTSSDSYNWCVSHIDRHWDSCRKHFVFLARCLSQHVSCVRKIVPPKCKPVYGYPPGDQSKKNCSKIPISCRCAV